MSYVDIYCLAALVLTPALFITLHARTKRLALEARLSPRAMPLPRLPIAWPVSSARQPQGR